MRTRIALFVLLAVGIVSGAQLSSIVLASSPYDTDKSGLWLFFITFYVCLTIVLGLIWYAVHYLKPRRGVKPALWPSMRQAGLASLVLVLSIFFNTLGIFQVWDIIPLLIAAVLIEFFFQADKKPHATISYDPEQ